MEAGLSLQLSPVVNRLDGAVGETLGGMTTAKWSPTRALAVEGQLGAAQTIPRTQAGAFAVVSDGIALAYRLNELVDLRCGVRSAWTSALEDNASSFLWVAFVGATIRAPLVRF